MGELYQWLPILLCLLIAGVFAGTLAGLLGVGGGIINVPVLFFLFQYFDVEAGQAMVMATGTSLAIIVPTSLSSIRAHHRRGNVDWVLVRRWCLWMLLGVVFGGWLVTQVDGRYFTVLFAVFAAFVALRLTSRDRGALFPQLPPMPFQGLLGTFIGFLSVMVGIGGGALGVAILTAYSYAIVRAVGTAAVFGLIISLPGALLLLFYGIAPANAPVGTWGYINLPAFLVMAPLTVLAAPMGVWLGTRLSETALKTVFAVFLWFTAVSMVSQVF